jgi:hypothetical protein
MEDADVGRRAQALADFAGDFPSALSYAAPTGTAYASLRDLVLQGDPGIARLQQDRAIEATMRCFLDISWALSGTSGRKSLPWATGSFPRSPRPGGLPRS